MDCHFNATRSKTFFWALSFRFYQGATHTPRRVMRSPRIAAGSPALTASRNQTAAASEYDYLTYKREQLLPCLKKRKPRTEFTDNTAIITNHYPRSFNGPSAGAPLRLDFDHHREVLTR